MPFTPWHMGPGILFKAFLQGSFSLMVFGWSQIVTDIQPLWVLVAGHGHLHGFTHTYIGATVLAVFSALSGKYLAALGLRMLGLSQFLPVSWHVAFVSAGIGTYSHVVLDSVMHADLEPFWPFTSSNGLLGLLSVEALHWFCLACGALGGALYFFLAGRHARHNNSLNTDGPDGPLS